MVSDIVCTEYEIVCLLLDEADDELRVSSVGNASAHCFSSNMPCQRR